MKILFINLPFAGHVLPTLGLVDELIKKDMKVTYLLTPEWEDKVIATGAKFVSYPSHNKLSTLMRNAYDSALLMIEDFDLIVYEHFFFLGKPLADKFNKPVIRLFTTVAANDELINGYVNSGGLFSIFRSNFISKQWTKDVAKGIPLKTDNWLKEITHNSPELNLVYTIREFQLFADDFPDERYKFLCASIYQRNNVEVIPINEISKPLIYISLGTVFNNNKDFYRKCMEAFKDENVSVIMSIGNKIQKNSLGTVPDNFLIYPYVPQLEVLKQADVFITHGGANSINEALYFGVPMVVIPASNDQPTNAERIAELNLGKQLNRKKLTVNDLKNTTLSIMKEDQFRVNVLKMKEKMRTAGGNKLGADLIIEFLKRGI